MTDDKRLLAIEMLNHAAECDTCSDPWKDDCSEMRAMQERAGNCPECGEAREICQCLATTPPAR